MSNLFLKLKRQKKNIPPPIEEPPQTDEEAYRRVREMALYRVGDGCWFVIADSITGTKPYALALYHGGQFWNQKVVADPPFQEFSKKELQHLADRAAKFFW